MDGVYNELAGHAEMQMDLIRDGEPVPPIGDINYYEEMAINCEKWPAPIARLIAIECRAFAQAFAFENDYHVVTLTDYKGFTQVALYSLCEGQGKARLVPEMMLCANSHAGVSTILLAYQKQHGKLIVV